MLPNNEKERTTDIYNNTLDEPPWNHAQKKSQFQMVAYACFHLHNFLEMSFFFFFFLRNSEQIRGLQKLRVGKREMNVVIKRST